LQSAAAKYQLVFSRPGKMLPLFLGIRGQELLWLSLRY
jgi:hypothetical protein